MNSDRYANALRYSEIQSLTHRLPALKASLDEAIVNNRYWQRQAVIRVDPAAKALALGLANAWATTTEARRTAHNAARADLAALQAESPAPATAI